MASMTWIKIVTTIFDDEKIKIIDSFPDRDALLVIWFKILCQAGKSGCGGLLVLADRIPLSEEMLSTVFNRPVNTVRLALKTFQKFGMIEITQEKIISVPKWEKYQQADYLEIKKEQDRIRQRRHRDQIKLIGKNDLSRDNSVTVTSDKSHDGHMTVTLCHAADIDIDKEEDKDKDKEEDIVEIAKNAITDPPSHERSPNLPELWKTYCPSLPQIREISEQRRRKIKTRLEEHPNEKWWIEVFKNLENSDFCKGSNRDGWKATFDWLIHNQENAIKVLEGKYSNNPRRQNFSSMDEKFYKSEEKYDVPLGTDPDELERKAAEKLREMYGNDHELLIAGGA